jgi:hypothetical protein
VHEIKKDVERTGQGMAARVLGTQTHRFSCHWDSRCWWD